MQVIKGCWQLSGGHRGDAASDRTSGSEAEQDFAAFAAAGVTTFDTADHYGPSEQLIGGYCVIVVKRSRWSADNRSVCAMHACDWCLGCIWLVREPAEHHRTHSIELGQTTAAGRFLRDGGNAAEDVTVLTKACIWGSNLGKAGRSGVLEKVSRHLS